MLPCMLPCDCQTFSVGHSTSQPESKSESQLNSSALCLVDNLIATVVAISWLALGIPKGTKTDKDGTIKQKSEQKDLESDA